MTYVRVDRGHYLCVDHGDRVSALHVSPPGPPEPSHCFHVLFSWKPSVEDVEFSPLLCTIAFSWWGSSGEWSLETEWVVGTHSMSVFFFFFTALLPFTATSTRQLDKCIYLTSSKDKLRLLKMHWMRVSISSLRPWCQLHDVMCDIVLILLFYFRLGEQALANAVGQQQWDGMSCQSDGGQPFTVGRQA